jgi:methyl-accepting chemotaxis protein
MDEAAKPAEAQKFQRRTVLVKRSLQLKYVAMVFFSVLLASAIVGADIYYSMSKIILLENPSLQPMVTQFNAVILVKLAMYLAIVLGISLYVSHRFAGPIYRFEKSAQTVSSGDLTHRVSLRTGDELLELQEEFNGMLASLQALVQKDRNLAGHVAERLASALKKLPEGAATEAARVELDSAKKELEHLTQAFKV